MRRWHGFAMKMALGTSTASASITTSSSWRDGNVHFLFPSFWLLGMPVLLAGDAAVQCTCTHALASSDVDAQRDKHFRVEGKDAIIW